MKNYVKSFKKYFLGLLVCTFMILAFLPLSANAQENDEDLCYETDSSNLLLSSKVPTETEAYEAMIAFKDSYPEGTSYDNSNYYAWNGDNSGGRGCVGFAYMLSDAAFGKLPARKLTNISIDEVHVGDILRVSNNSHTVIILEKYDDYVVLAEGNYNSSVHWGRTMTADEVAAANYVLTRYPVGTFSDGVTITFDGNAGSSGAEVNGLIANQIVDKGHNFTLYDVTPTMDGYTFKGWAASSDATAVSYYSGYTYNFSENITLYAVWEKNTETTYGSTCTFTGVKLYVYKDGKLGLEFVFNVTLGNLSFPEYNFISEAYNGTSSYNVAYYEKPSELNTSTGVWTYHIIQEITPDKIADTSYVRLDFKNDYGTLDSSDSVSISVLDYIDEVMNGESATDEQKALLVSLLNYASSIQEYFGSEDDPVNSTLTESQRTLTLPSGLDSYAASVSGSCPGIEYIGTSLLIGSDSIGDKSITIRHYFRLSGERTITSYTVYKNDTYDISSSYVKTGDFYYYDINVKDSSKFGNAQLLTVEPSSDTSSDEDEDLTLYINYSVMSYVKAAYDNYLADNPSAASSVSLGLAGTAGSGADSLIKLVAALAKYYELLNNHA